MSSKTNNNDTLSNERLKTLADAFDALFLSVSELIQKGEVNPEDAKSPIKKAVNKILKKNLGKEKLKRMGKVARAVIAAEKS